MALDFDKLDLIREPSTVEVYFADIQGCRYRDVLGQKLSLGSGDVPNVFQEEFHPAV